MTVLALFAKEWRIEFRPKFSRKCWSSSSSRFRKAETFSLSSFIPEDIECNPISIAWNNLRKAFWNPSTAAESLKVPNDATSEVSSCNAPASSTNSSFARITQDFITSPFSTLPAPGVDRIFKDSSNVSITTAYKWLCAISPSKLFKIAALNWSSHTKSCAKIVMVEVYNSMTLASAATLVVSAQELSDLTTLSLTALYAL
mmetsp:Transcript_14644/g.19267  ORF Transcript_14644/g.19267 Transcript_14644/m.19267 type:complete len:201 (+) Transcript_14644:3908-4510(+)